MECMKSISPILVFFFFSLFLLQLLQTRGVQRMWASAFMEWVIASSSFSLCTFSVAVLP